MSDIIPGSFPCQGGQARYSWAKWSWRKMLKPWLWPPKYWNFPGFPVDFLKKNKDKPFDCLDQDPDPLWPYGPLYVPPFGLHIFSGHARPIPPEDLEVPLWFAAREASLQRDDRPFPFGKCGRLPGQKKSTGTDGSLMMIDDPWWFHNSMTQWHPMTIVDGFLSKSKALRRPNYAITFCLGKNSEWPLQKRIGHGPTMSKYVQVPGTPWNSSKWVPRFGQMPPVGLWPNLTRQKKSARCERSALSAGGTGWDLWELERILTSTGHLGDKYSGQWVQHMN